MESKESLTDWLTKTDSHAKAQSRKEDAKDLRTSFASLRLCVKFLLVLAFLVIPCFAQQRLPMKPADIVKLANVADPQISPNAQWVVYTVSSVDDDKNVSTLWLARAAVDSYTPTPIPSPSPRRPTAVEWPEIRNPPRPLLPSGWNASNPRWSPDSNSIAFLANHDDQDGLWVIKLDKPEQPRFLAPVTTTSFFITYASFSLCDSASCSSGHPRHQ